MVCITSYILRRLLQLIPVLFMISLVSFFLLVSMPGDPIDMLVLGDPEIEPEDIENLRRIYGLDQPMHLRYLRWMGQLLQGDLGSSRNYKMPVLDLIRRNLNNTLILVGSSMIFALVIAIPIGVYSAVRQYSVGDYVGTIFSFFGFSVPNHWLGLLFIYAFAVYLRVLPPGGFRSTQVPPGFWNLFMDRLSYLILPMVTLGISSMAAWTRYMRSSVLEVIRQDYIRTARAKGLSERVVIFKHALRNALITIITLIMLYIPSIFGGAIITEAVFAFPGMGRLFWRSLISHDTFVTMSILMFLAFLTVIFNLMADVTYALVDPRIRYD